MLSASSLALVLMSSITAAATPSGQWLLHEYHGDAGTRRYRLYVPSGYDPARPAPLVVMLHGCTQDAEDLARGTRMNALAEADTLLVAYPEQPEGANAKKCWNWYDPAHQRRGAGEPAIVAGITREVMERWAVDARRVYLAGISAGGAMALITAIAYPELYEAVGLHSAVPYGVARDVMQALAVMQRGAADEATAIAALPAEAPRRAPRAIVFHGARDGVVAARNGEQVAAQLLALRGSATATVEWSESVGGRRVSRSRRIADEGTVVLERWLVEELGHAWSGGSPEGSFTEAQGPDASREMLRFFSEGAR